jgi:hypothetical protein
MILAIVKLEPAQTYKNLVMMALAVL